MTRAVAICGAGLSAVARDLTPGAARLAADAARAALADAGLAPADVDGIASYPGGTDGVTAFALARGIGAPGLSWFSDLAGWTPAAIAPVLAACDAVATGECETAIAFRAVKRRRSRPPGLGFEGRVEGDAQFRAPFGDSMTAQWLAMWARRHMHEHGTTEDHLGAVATTFRAHAALNPEAAIREPLTLEDYRRSPYVTTPFRVLDCDYPVDGAGAVVVTTLERARDLRRPAVRVLGGAQSSGPVPDWDQWEDLTRMASAHAASQLWRRTGLRASDLDVAMVYDGFSWLALCWLEDLGVCEKGEGGPFFAEGRAGLRGDLPTNTHGGSLSGGRLHGITHVVECVRQLRGEAAERQVAGARTGIATAGGGTMAGAVLLTAD